MPSATVNSVELYYQITGSGHPLLLLHGLGSSSDDWYFQTPTFARHFQVIAPNLRGHKFSSPVRGPLTIAALAADVAQLLDALGMGTTSIVGLSLGGLVAQVLAIDFPAKFNKLVLVNTFAHLWPTSWREAYALGRRALVSRCLPVRATAGIVARDLFPKPEQGPLRQAVLDRIGMNDTTSYRYLVSAIRHFDSRAQLDQISQPTLLISGDRDAVVPRSCQRQLARGIPRADWKMVRDSGHATPVDQPEEFNRLALDFLLASEG